MGKKPWAVVTQCCGTITRCESGCVLQYVAMGGGKCVHCGWVYDMMPGQRATPISIKEMKAAHTNNPYPVKA